MAEYVSHDEANQILAECKANVERLTTCDRHEFERYVARPDRFVCLKCGGWLSVDAVHWYELGRTHGYTEANQDSLIDKKQRKRT